MTTTLATRRDMPTVVIDQLRIRTIGSGRGSNTGGWLTADDLARVSNANIAHVRVILATLAAVGYAKARHRPRPPGKTGPPENEWQWIGPTDPMEAERARRCLELAQAAIRRGLAGE